MNEWMSVWLAGWNGANAQEGIFLRRQMCLSWNVRKSARAHARNHCQANKKKEENSNKKREQKYK